MPAIATAATVLCQTGFGKAAAHFCRRVGSSLGVTDRGGGNVSPENGKKSVPGTARMGGVELAHQHRQ